MNEAEKLAADATAWDTGALGQDEQHAVRADLNIEKELDEALGLKPISLRLPVSLIQDLKFIAKVNCIGYQPLMRDVLVRFAASEKKSIMMDLLERKRLEMENQALSEQSQAKVKVA